eukprot:PITA_27825
MVEEYDSIIRNSVWDVVPRPQGKSVVNSRWLYKIDVGTISLDGVEDPLDGVKTTFLNGKIEEEVYIEQPEGFKTFDRELHVCRLKRALYGLNQAPRAWYTKIDIYFTGLGFTKSEANVNLYHIMVEGSPSNLKRTSGRIFNLGSTTVSRYNRKQRSVSLSLAEAEYMAASQVACEAIWMRKVLVGLFGQRMDPPMIYCDNQSCIKLSENLDFHDRSKHIDIWYHHLRDCVVKRIMLLLYVSTEEQDVDILMKALSKCKFEFHRDRIGVTDNPFLVEREC